jgi:hypothetical protein
MVAGMKNIFLIAACQLCFSGVVMAAEQFGDPTRPAFELVPGLSADGATDVAAAKAEMPPAGLQSVILSPAREAAIINGVEVERGQQYGDAVLTVVNETCVVLMGPQGRQVIHMFPTVNMSKNELACTKRVGMKPVVHAMRGAGTANKSGKIGRKKPKNKKIPVVCAPEEIKDGGKK